MVGTGEVDICQGRGFARSAVWVVVVALAASLARLLGRALGGLPSQLAGRSRRCRLPSSRVAAGDEAAVAATADPSSGVVVLRGARVCGACEK